MSKINVCVFGEPSNQKGSFIRFLDGKKSVLDNLDNLENINLDYWESQQGGGSGSFELKNESGENTTFFF